MSVARTSSTKQSTSTILTYLEATFSSPKTQLNSEPMSHFYAAIKKAVASVRSAVENTDNDKAFKKAADILSTLADTCKDMETVSAKEAGDKMQNWIKEMKNIGTDGVMNVQGKASRMLAEYYMHLLERLAKGEFWPVTTTPRLTEEFLPDWLKWLGAGPSFATVYPINFLKNGGKTRIEDTISTLKQRIANFDESKLLADAEKTSSSEPLSQRSMKF